MTFTAGQKLRASEINDLINAVDYVNTDLSVTSSTALASSDIAVALEANTTYVLDGFIAYNAGATGDFKIALNGPTGATGSWAAMGLATSTTASVGSINGVRLDAFTDTQVLSLGGSDSLGSALYALLRGVITTGATSGSLVLRYAQNTSNGTASILKNQSWIRAGKVL